MKESEDFLDNLLFNAYSGYYEVDAVFLLNKNNYISPYNIFREKFKLNHKNNSNNYIFKKFEWIR